MDMFNMVMNAYKNKIAKEYQRVYYIEGTGGAYIKTNYNATNESRVILDVELTTEGTDIYGYYNKNEKNRFHIYNATGYIEAGWGEEHRSLIKLRNKRYLFEFDKQNFYIDGQLKHTFSDFAFKSGNITIGMLYRSTGNLISNYSPQKIYRNTYYTNNVIVHDFVPCYRKTDNNVGMYDLVDGLFYENAGRGEFIAGPII